jgi:hypothetical protein
VDGNLIIKEGAGLEFDGADRSVIIGANLPESPGELNTVIDISGPGSRMLWRTTGPNLQYYVDIGGNYYHQGKGAKSITLNISDGGSFVFDLPTYSGTTSGTSIGEAANVKLNITGAGSRMAILTQGNLSELGRIGNISPATTLEFALGRGGVLDLRNGRLEVFHSHFRYTIGNDGTGRTASGLFRSRRARHASTDVAIAVDPCTKLNPGDQFLLAEYTEFGGTWRDGDLLPNLIEWLSDGKVVTLPNGGQYTNQGYTFTINYNVPLGYNYPGTSQDAMGTVATVTKVPTTQSASCSTSVQLVAGSDVSSIPFAVTGPGCAPGLYSGTQTLFVKPYSMCKNQHHARTINGDNTAWRFGNWPDRGTTRERTIAITDASAYWVAKMQQQYRLSTSIRPAGSGSVTGGGWHDSGTAATVAVSSVSAGYKFLNWSGPVAAPASAATTVPMSGPQSVRRAFNFRPAPA